MIRKATAEDAATLLQLIQGIAEYERLSDSVRCTTDSLLQYGFSQRPFFEALLYDMSEEQGLRTVGFALYFFTYSTFTGKPTLYLEDLFVRPEYRGHGIGSKLFAELVRIANEVGCGRMEWSVLDWNEPAINFYQKLGAVAMSEWTVFRLDETALSQLSARDPGEHSKN